MKKKEKQRLLILIIMALAILFTIWFLTRPKEDTKIIENEKVEEFVQELEDGTKLNTSTKLKEVKKIENLEVGNIQLTYQNGSSVVLADVVNNSNKTSSLMVVKITLLDKNGKELETLSGIIGALKPGESTQLNMGATADYANAYDFTIIKK